MKNDDEAPTPDPYAASEASVGDPYARDDRFGSAQEPEWPTWGTTSDTPPPPAKGTHVLPPSLPQMDQPSQKKRPQQSIEPAAIAVACGATGVVNFISGATVGAVVGLLVGGAESMQAPTLDAGVRVRHIGHRVGGTAVQFGGFLGGYTGLRCAFKGLRGGKNDALNSGLAAGVVAGLPVLRTGTPRAALATALSSGALMMFVDTLMGHSHSSSSESSSHAR